MTNSEIKIPKTMFAIVMLTIGAAVLAAGLAGYMILVRVHWLGWEGVIAACAIIMCGGALLLTGWNAWQVLRE